MAYLDPDGGRDAWAVAERASAIETARLALLVSAIFNFIACASGVLAALFLLISIVGIIALPCMGVIIIAQGILGVFELSARTRLASPHESYAAAAQLRTIAIFEILTILVGNIAGLVCGIVNLTKVDAIAGQKM
ncbi:MAG: hypothetical protein RBS39_00910 [Phycisphaerales bacterium]|jgi:hypothetical protein|nr:hypothetical protein [Phycisphaerales bacterium]